jgi:hypothetical protein
LSGAQPSLMRSLSIKEEIMSTMAQMASAPEVQDDGLYERLMGTLNIKKDPVGCVDLIGKSLLPDLPLLSSIRTVHRQYSP